MEIEQKIHATKKKTNKIHLSDKLSQRKHNLALIG